MDAFGIAGWLFSLLAGSFLLQKAHHSSRSISGVALFHGSMDIFFSSRSPEGVQGVMGGVVTLLGLLVVIGLVIKGEWWQRQTRLALGSSSAES